MKDSRGHVEAGHAAPHSSDAMAPIEVQVKNPCASDSQVMWTGAHMGYNLGLLPLSSWRHPPLHVGSSISSRRPQRRASQPPRLPGSPKPLQIPRQPKAAGPPGALKDYGLVLQDFRLGAACNRGCSGSICIVWYDMVWYDIVWYRIVWYDIVSYTMVWYNSIV